MDNNDHYCSACGELLDVYSMMEGSSLCGGDVCLNDDEDEA